MRIILVLLTIIIGFLSLAFISDNLLKAPLVKAQADDWQRRSQLDNLKSIDKFAQERQEHIDAQIQLAAREKELAVLEREALIEKHKSDADYNRAMAFVLPIVGTAVGVIVAIVAIVILFAALSGQNRQKQIGIRIIRHVGQHQYLLTDGQNTDWYDARIPADKQIIRMAIDQQEYV